MFQLARPMTRLHWLLGMGVFFTLVLSHLIWGAVDIALFAPLETVHREILLYVRVPLSLIHI